MSDETQPRSSISRPLLWGGLAMLLLIAAVSVWTAWRQAQIDRLIQQKLAALRAAGEPVTGADLAKLFPAPPPELDAMRYFSNAMEFAARNPSPYVSPIVSKATLGRTAALDASSLSVLRAYQSDTASISNLIAPFPAGARFGNQWNPSVMNAPVVPFFKVRCLMQSLCTRAFYSAEVGDAEEASRMLASGFRFAGALSPSESTLVERMIRVACLGLACNTTERCLNRTRFSEQQLARILDAMPAADTNGIAATLRVEQCMAIEALRAVKAGKHLDDYTGARRDPWWKRVWQRLRTHRPEYRDEDFIRYLDSIPAMQRIATLPPAQSVPEARRLFDGFGSNTVSEIGEAIYPNWSKGLANLYKNEAHLAALKMALHVERFRNARGALPSALETLVPEFTPAISPDLFDGKPLRFKALTNGFAVYSIGIDGIDNGGLENTNANASTNCDVTVIVER